MDLIEKFKRWKAQGGGMSDSDSETSDSEESKATSDSDSLAWDLTMKAHISPVLLDPDFEEVPLSSSSDRITDSSSNATSNVNIVHSLQPDVKQTKNQRESPSKALNRRPEANSSIPVHLKQNPVLSSTVVDSSSVSSSKKTHQVPTAVATKPVPPSSSSNQSSNNKQVNQSVEDRNRSKSTGVRNDVNQSSKGQDVKSVSQKFLFPSLEEVSCLDRIVERIKTVLILFFP